MGESFDRLLRPTPIDVVLETASCLRTTTNGVGRQRVRPRAWIPTLNRVQPRLDPPAVGDFLTDLARHPGLHAYLAEVVVTDVGSRRQGESPPWRSGSAHGASADRCRDQRTSRARRRCVRSPTFWPPSAALITPRWTRAGKSGAPRPRRLARQTAAAPPILHDARSREVASALRPGSRGRGPRVPLVSRPLALGRR